MNAIRVFVDSDVLVSSLLSESGVSSSLLSLRFEGLKLYISTVSLKEISRVVRRLGIPRERLNKVLSRFEVVSLEVSTERIKKELKPYTRDPNDCHVIAGAVKAKVKFLLTYNLKHFDSEKIKTDLDIVVMKPATFLQYLRST